jgi:glucan phosphoethanolaminetransferase (alkaline phosphatase superfamily)
MKRTISLLLVLILATICILFGHSVPISFSTPFAYFWQDALIAGLFGVVDSGVTRISKSNASVFKWSQTAIWIIYSFIVLYTAINVPVALVLSTVLTWPLLRAAGGPLTDSIALYLNFHNVGLILLIIGVAVVLPLLFRRSQRGPQIVTAFLIAVLLLAGPSCTKQIDTSGMHRNAILTLILTAFPSSPVKSTVADWHAGSFETQPAEDLSYLRGIAAGRNVVLVSLESTAARYLKEYGATEDPTPNLTRISSQAILFENAYAAYPESIKGLFSVICSTYPAINTDPEIYEQIRTPSLAALLASDGYRTGLFHSGRFAYLGMESVIRNRGYDTLEDAGDIGGDYNSSFGIDDPSTVRRLLSWVDGLPKDQRFFITYLPIAGHHPYATPGRGPFPDTEETNRYRNALHYGDAALGELVRGFEQRGLDKNTLWVFYGDHGEGFNQHEGNVGHTLYLYDENVHVPLLIVVPDAVRQQIRIRRPASLVDITPTILDLLNLPAPVAYQGRSLIADNDRNPIPLFMTDYSLHLVGLRDERWKFIHDLDSGRSKLFDLSKDFHESDDLSSEFPERVSAYRDYLSSWCGSQSERIRGH